MIWLAGRSRAATVGMSIDPIVALDPERYV